MESDIRIKLFLWLKEKSYFNGGVFSRADLQNGFEYMKKRITLVGPKGIWFPKGFSAPISISTTRNGPYEDGFSSDGFLEYCYRGDDPNHPDNKGLVNAYNKRIPLVYFHSIKPGKYVAVWPVFILENDVKHMKVKVAIDPAYDIFDKKLLNHEVDNYTKNDSDIGVRKYITAITKQRLHQSTFREFVLEAYSHQCTMCRLKHVELLDAAHIIPDCEAEGIPVINNGLSLCKIHHAAYDKNIIGITPNFEIKVRTDILKEVDGPMLKYGLQSLDGNKIILPLKRSDYPDRDRLARRYENYLSA